MVRNGVNDGMMGITYAIIEEKYDHLNGYRVSYGIAMYSSVKKGKEASLVDSIHDITSDKKKLEKLVADCNRLQLSSVHIVDVVEDFLAE